MNVLAMQFGLEGACAVFRDSMLASAICSERLSRIRKQRGVTREALQYAISAAGLKGFEDIDAAVVVDWFESHHEEHDPYSRKAQQGLKLRYASAGDVSYAQWLEDDDCLTNKRLRLGFDGHSVPCLSLRRELATPYAAFLPSAATYAFSLMLNGNAAGASRAVVYLQMGEGVVSFHHPFEFSEHFRVGRHFNEIVEHLGFFPSAVFADRVMQLAALGEPLPDWDEMVWTDTGFKSGVLADVFQKILLRSGCKRLPDVRVMFPETPSEMPTLPSHHLDRTNWDLESPKTIAATIQRVLEQSVSNAVRAVAEIIGPEDAICLVGDVFSNTRSNAVALEGDMPARVIMAPTPGPSSAALGAGLYFSHTVEIVDDELTPIIRPRPVYTTRDLLVAGRPYPEPMIAKAITDHSSQLRTAGIKVARAGSREQYLQHVVRFLEQGKLVGVFHGGSEFGRYGLGRRSIIADPRRADTRDRLNAVLQRESFFTPAAAVLDEHADAWFQLPGCRSPFKLLSVKARQATRVPAVVHADQRTQLHTVESSVAEDFHAILDAWRQHSGVPVLVSDDLAPPGEPLCETPGDGLRMMLNTNLDVLLLENYCLLRSRTPGDGLQAGETRS